jgi:DNA-binding CsgD family transcriptional regulator
MSTPTLTDFEREVIELIDEGYARWRIAEILDVGETSVRRTIRSLCERYDVPMRDLPDAVDDDPSDASL